MVCVDETYPSEIVLAKSIERKPAAAALLATPKRGAKAGGRRSAVPSFLPIASHSEAATADAQSYTTFLVRYSPLALRPIDPTDGG
jgi:hypothetical protein